MPFQKGQSGNPGGRSKDRPWAEALRLVAFQSGPEGRRRLLAIAEKCVAAAEAGDLQAMKEIGDRLDGKPVQESTVEVTRHVAKEMTDDELAAIAAGRSEGTDPTPRDPSQLH